MVLNRYRGLFSKYPGEVNKKPLMPWGRSFCNKAKNNINKAIDKST